MTSVGLTVVGLASLGADLLQDVLPKRFQNLADDAGGTITIDEYNEKVLRGET